MARFDTYFLMKAPDAAEYARAKLDGFGPGADLDASEIGDGNLNYIFRVVDRRSGRSVVIKQAGDTARISSDFKIATDRNRIEHDILKLEGDLAPGLVPRVYRFDPVMSCCAMEDLSDHVIMRRALLDRVKLPRFADDITTFIQHIRAEYAQLPLFLGGHSSGAALALNYASQADHEPVAGYVFSRRNWALARTSIDRRWPRLLPP